MIWFTPDLRAYQLLVARKGFADADELFTGLLALQQGEDADEPTVPVPDPRRGLR